MESMPKGKTVEFKLCPEMGIANSLITKIADTTDNPIVNERYH